MPPPGANIIHTRRQKDGYGTVANPEKFLDQDSVQLKQYCLTRRLRFVDDMFPPDKTSLGEEVLSPETLARVKWLRPRYLVPNPAFFVDGVSRFDFVQGAVGNCWLLAPIGAMTFEQYFFQQVVPPDQSFGEGYCGLFHFRFWRFGRWVDVVIDDKLPTVDGKLLFASSKNLYEFWPALLEKAYAKVCGSYSDMNAGFPGEALVDFTGGVHMQIPLKEPPSNLWEMMSRAGKSKSLMVCSIQVTPFDGSDDIILPNGLVRSHAYTVTGLFQVTSNGKLVNLVRLWNPWGQGEWNADWSDRSPLWDTVSPKDREWCLSVAEDGEFWMALEDLCKFYNDLDICCLCPKFLDGNSECHWTSSLHEGRWVAGTTCGGASRSSETYWTNPQYRVKIERFSSESSTSQGEKNTLVTLMQKPDKRNRCLVQSLPIGFSIYKVTKEYETWRGKFPASFFCANEPVAGPKALTNTREVMEFVALPPGEYLIVPSTCHPDETASFILAIVSKATIHICENAGGLHEPVEDEEPTSNKNEAGEENKTVLDRQLSQKYEEVDAEQLQMILNEKILKGDLKTGGFSLEACRSMVALLDLSITGKLSNEEFLCLWNKIITYKDIFSRTDVSQTGTLSVSELQTALMALGMRMRSDLLNLMALRYSFSSGRVTLESFIMLVLRLDCMNRLFNQLSDGMTLTLHEKEWLYLSMYN